MKKRRGIVALKRGRFRRVNKVLNLMKTGATREVTTDFVEGDTTRVLSGTIYTHKDLTLQEYI
ncbi:MAG: hypothetical protein JJW00_03740 [Sulfurimonas sp.]|nr:hypothetical protein [Sulfurimonas sp.]